MSNAKQVKAVEPLINGLPSTHLNQVMALALFNNKSPYSSGTLKILLATQADLTKLH